MKDIILNKNGQISLICFLSIFIIQPVLILLVKFGLTLNFLYLAIYIITLLLSGLSLVFGIIQFKKTKFALWWVIPAFVYFLLVIFTSYYYLGEKKVIYPRQKTSYSNKRKIGVFLGRTIKGEVQIIAVLYKSKAARTGLLGGDIITKINDEIVDGQEIVDVINLIGLNSNDTLAIEIERNGKKKIFNIDMTINENNPDSKL